MRKIIYLLLFFLPFLSFAESGQCVLTQQGDGTFRIVCDGDGIIYYPVAVTNEVVYRVADCEELKQNLFGATDGVRDETNFLRNNDLPRLESGINQLDRVNTFFDNYQYGENVDPELYTPIEDLNNSYNTLSYLPDAFNDSLNNIDSSLSGIDRLVSDIRCCPTNSTSCSPSDSCSCDFSEIIEKLNTQINRLNFITNSLTSIQKSIFDEIGGFGDMSGMFNYANILGNRFSIMKYFALPYLDPYSSSTAPYYNLVNINYKLLENSSIGLTSLNNYFYRFLYTDLALANTNLSFLTSATTNFFSFFRGELGVNGVLEDWKPQFGSYHDYLTNHYVKSVIDPSSLSSSEREKTNWFARVETLLASLVFADDSTSTNTVDASYGNDQVSQLTSGLESITQTSSSQLGVFQQTSESLVSRVRSFSSAFSDASMPSTVRLVKLDNSDSSFIQFESSEISPLVEACHCATTLAWCLGGLILLFWFIHYTVKASYNLVVFIYSVISSIFSK